MASTLLSWSDVAQTIRSILEIMGALACAWALAWTVFRPFTKERLYGLLRSDFGARSGFVLGVLGDPKHTNKVAQVVMEAVSHPQNRDRFRTIVGDLLADELAANRKTRESVTEIGRLVGEVVQRNEALEDIATKMGQSQSQLATTTAVMAESIKTVSKSVDHLRTDVQKLSDKMDRTTEIMLKREPVE